MKIIHSADWHLCDKLGRIDRAADLMERVGCVAGICTEQKADVLLIAGDIFSKEATVEEMTRTLNQVRERFAAFFAAGGTVLGITGNHDLDGRINMVRAGMSLAVPAAGPRLTRGRMYLLNGRGIATLTGTDGHTVQFVFVPYPFATRYGLSAADYRTKEEENRILQSHVADWIQSLPLTAGEFDSRLPTVLIAHLHVRSAEVHSLYRMTEREDIVFDLADLNPDWAYVALGHIHKPQAIQGRENIRYCGSLDRLDFGEKHEDHGVLVVEIGKSGLARPPERVPIRATPFHRITLTDPEAELPALAERFPDRATAIVSVAVDGAAAGPSRDEITRQLKRIFPRLYGIDWSQQPHDQSAERSEFSPQADLSSNVRRYLAKQLASDPDKDALLALADDFLRVEAQP